MRIVGEYLFSIEVFGIEGGLDADLEVVDIRHAQPFLPDLSVELAGEIDGEVRIYLDVVFCQRVLRILGRIDSDVPIAYRDILLEEVDPAVILP